MASHASLHISHALPSPWTAACIHVHIDIYMHATQHGASKPGTQALEKKKAEGVGGREGRVKERPRARNQTTLRVTYGTIQVQ